MSIRIVYEDADILVINKPSGLITHPKNAEDKQESVTGWLVEKYPEIKNVGEDPSRPGPVHRVDKDITGVLSIPSTHDPFLFLNNLFPLMVRHFLLKQTFPTSCKKY